jgi:hypothetical protein
MAGNRFFTRNNKPMADKLPDEGKLEVIVDQDGIFLRLERGGKELTGDEDYELYEEEVEKEDDDEELTKTPEKPEAESGDKCVDCQGTGLKSDTEICKTCEGSGKVA